jgi:hypothetical protein
LPEPEPEPEPAISCQFEPSLNLESLTHWPDNNDDDEHLFLDNEEEEEEEESEKVYQSQWTKAEVKIAMKKLVSESYLRAKKGFFKSAVQCEVNSLYDFVEILEEDDFKWFFIERHGVDNFNKNVRLLYKDFKSKFPPHLIKAYKDQDEFEMRTWTTTVSKDISGWSLTVKSPKFIINNDIKDEMRDDFLSVCWDAFDEKIESIPKRIAEIKSHREELKARNADCRAFNKESVWEQIYYEIPFKEVIILVIYI